MHQILFETRQNCYKNLWHDKIWFWKGNSKQNSQHSNGFWSSKMELLLLKKQNVWCTVLWYLQDCAPDVHPTVEKCVQTVLQRYSTASTGRCGVKMPWEMAQLRLFFPKWQSYSFCIVFTWICGHTVHVCCP